LRHMQQGERLGLAALAEHIAETYGGAARELLAPLVAVPFRRLLPTCTREERQRIATTLGGFTSALAVDLIRCLIHDEDGQVRSSAVQSLADLACEEAVPVLLEALRDSNSDVRWIATRALGQRPGTTAVELLPYVRAILCYVKVLSWPSGNSLISAPSRRSRTFYTTRISRYAVVRR
jgi:hypothetical protein